MINNIWIIVELLASIIECYMITHYISNFLDFKLNENKFKKKMLFLTLTAFNNIILSQFLQIDALIGIIQLIIALVFTFVFMKGSYFKKIFVSFTSIFLILIINSGVLFIFSKILNEDIQVLVSSIGIFRLLILFITKFLYYILTLILIKIFKKDEYRLSKEDLIYILIVFLINLIIGNLMFEYALKNNNNFSMLFNIIFVFLVSTNIISYLLLRRIKYNANNEKENTDNVNTTFNASEITPTLNLKHKKHNKLYNEAEDYLNQNNNQEPSAAIIPDSSFINAVANSKLQECNRKKIKLNINCTRLINIFSEEDMGIILSIVLDKTIEHCSYDKISSKIDLKIVNENNHLSIIISFTHNDNFISGAYKNSLTEDVIINRIVEKYQGLITFDDKEKNLFIVNIWLKSNKPAINQKTHFLQQKKNTENRK